MKKALKTTKVQIKPLGDRVLVRPFTEEALRKTSGKTPSYGIILPDTVTKEKSAQGKVLAVGEGKWLEGKLVPINIKVGDTIIFSKYGYDEVSQDGEELYLLKEDNVLAVIK
ncbi:MAG: co-chaperone GroES [Patescibacteria group bacterium]